MKTSEHT